MNDPKAAAAYHPGDAPVTRPDLDAIRARADAATPGPWDHLPYDDVTQAMSCAEQTGEHEWQRVGIVPAEHIRNEDAEFIAHAREDVPALLAALAAERARADQAEQHPRDEYHTMDELYDYRMLYNALAFNAWAESGAHPVVKSWRHSDGELCFGGGWFIVTATLPTGLVSNHYRAEHWDLFRISEDTPPKYDGHTPEVAAQRMRDLLAAPTA